MGVREKKELLSWVLGKGFFIFQNIDSCYRYLRPFLVVIKLTFVREKILFYLIQTRCV
jgi:hypothetical protein